MDKKPIEILAEIVGSSTNFVKRDANNKNANVPVPFALEAMKIFGKQCFIAGLKTGEFSSGKPVDLADEYLNGE
jgi:hypothetical protein